MLRKEELNFWVDLNLPRSLVTWLKETYGVRAQSFAEMGFEKASDAVIYKRASAQTATIIITTKDIDFVSLSKEKRLKFPKVLYLNIGNVSNTVLREILIKSFEKALELLLLDENSVVEITQ